ncbi:replication association protein [Tomato leaf curl Cameroon alphasatellite [CM:OMHD3:Ok:09]]|uniref:Replication association protein n=2 Tax=Tomato leaf curl Cameroon alphasatellite TaxID=743040 RepID=E6Z7Z5_9VIRU|nr:replication association protein [Tomato leaf curl Cameroon alphasatellite [CM:OMHD3:Ok:09]]CBK25803.1 replication association protein [Tomato leaf curl Cameroon alphasatellite [CM:OMHD3:Ok:09]]CBK25809.1 replication association protein [Tomato leaf curl Cameroon alphasatellite [CM:AGLD1:Ag:09]]
MPSVQSSWWCFTVFFLSSTAPDLVPLFENTAVSYACWQEEESPTTKRRHLQGYLQCKGKRTLSQVKYLFGGLNPHLEKQRARKTDEARDYCMKEETRVSGPFEFGEYVAAGSHKRRQREAVERSPVRMSEENPSVFRRVKAKIAEEEFQKSAPEIQISNLKSWQLRLKQLLSRDPDDRTIFWVYGPTGGEGKSTFARDLYRSGSWFYTRGGSAAADNVAYQYIGCLGNNIVFDIPRDKKDYLQYSLVEMFKDRLVVSNKYEPIMAPMLNCIHVVVMSNFLPDMEKISSDRVHVIPCIPCGVCLKHHDHNIKCDEYLE